MTIRIEIILILVFATTLIIIDHKSETDSHRTFEQFKKDFGKIYQDDSYRQIIFSNNLALIMAHNANNSKSYTMKITQFADLTQTQFQQLFLNYEIGSKQRSATQIQSKHTSLKYNQVEIDWQLQGKTMPVKNQGMCASCWAFATVAAFESLLLIKGKNVLLSEQQLVDCSSKYGNKGCHGGQLAYAFDFMQKDGMVSASEYPYIAKDQNCKKAKGSYKIKQYLNVITCSALYDALVTQPVSVAVDALNWGFYHEGIFNECNHEVNHGVLVVGVTSEYWRIKNSWGIQWGEEGFIRISRGNTCSICQFSTFPVL